MNLSCADCNHFSKSEICSSCTNYSLFDKYVELSSLDRAIDPPKEKPIIAKKFDNGKVDWTLLQWKELEEVVEVLAFGANKYSRDNWKHVEPARYEKAAMRHLISYITGEKQDPESGKSHLAHLMCNVLFLMWNDNEKSV